MVSAQERVREKRWKEVKRGEERARELGTERGKSERRFQSKQKARWKICWQTAKERAYGQRQRSPIGGWIMIKSMLLLLFLRTSNVIKWWFCFSSCYELLFFRKCEKLFCQIIELLIFITPAVMDALILIRARQYARTDCFIIIVVAFACEP